ATRGRLRQALAVLRRGLEPAPEILHSDRSFVWLDSSGFSTDVAEFEGALRSAAGAVTPEQQQEDLSRAVALYQGELLPGFYEEWLLAERGRLAEAHLDALCQLAVTLAEGGDPARGVQYGRRAVALDPLREDAHCALMRAFAA